MKRFVVFVLFMIRATSLFADTFYVSTNNVNDGPGMAWSNAFHTIQGAVDTAAAGDTVLVTNGVYAIGVNGSEFTRIVGSGPRGDTATRCVYLATNATITGFTLSNGYTRAAGVGNDKRGGGIFMGAGSTVSQCHVQSCSAAWTGGGIYCPERGTILDCIIEGNQSVYGGGGLNVVTGTNLIRNCLIVGNETGNNGGGLSFQGATIVESCTIAGNHATYSYGGCDVGQSAVSIRNSIIYGNTADFSSDNWGWDTNKLSAQNSCALPILPGTHNTDANPAFATDDGFDYRLRYSSPCRNTGTNDTWMLSAPDIAGNNRLIDDIVDMGAHEFKLGALDCAMSATPRRGAQPLVVSFAAEAAGTNMNDVFYQWDFEDDGIWDVSGTNAALVTNLYLNPGYWSVVLAVSNGIGEYSSVTRTDYLFVSPSNLYVSPSGSHIFPFASWVTAATNIQQAVNAGSAGSVVLVAPATYTVTSAIKIAQGLSLRGYNGRVGTIIDGNGATRCVELDHPDAVLEALTLTHGWASDGAGVYCWAGTIRDCLLTDNHTIPTFGDDLGGGLYCVSGTVAGCTFVSNSTPDRGGGAYMENHAVVTNCTFNLNVAGYGGGLYTKSTSAIFFSDFIDNRTTWRDGGGLYCEGVAELNRVTFSGNTAERNGGGASFTSNAVLAACAFTANIATNGSGGGLQCGTPATLSVYGCAFNGNRAKSGGGIYAQHISVDDCQISQNQASSGGGGLSALNGIITDSTFNNNSASSGAGVQLQSGSVFDSDIIGNTAAGSINSSGGGCDVFNTLIVRCTISNNSAEGSGGGIYDRLLSRINDCTISGNSAGGAGGIRCGLTGTVTRCTIENNTARADGGGGIAAEAGGIIDACIVRGNLSTNIFHTYGGGAYLKSGSICRNSLLYDNTINAGGGAYGGGLYAASGAIVENCTVVGNASNKGSIPTYHGYGGGIFAGPDSAIKNCIIYYNTSEIDSNIDPIHAGVTFSCSTPEPVGSGNILGPPQFVNTATRNLKLQTASPCMDAGTTSGATHDYEGIPRPLDGNADGNAHFDIGAYEHLNTSANSDGDTMTDGDEQISDTDPTDSNDWFHVTSRGDLPFWTVYFDSSSNRFYTLLWCTNLVDGVWSNVPGTPPRMGVGGADSMTATNNLHAEFYKLTVELP